MQVLAAMDMDMEDKVLIALHLKTDEQIYKFLKWLKENMPEEEVKSRAAEITRIAVKISKT